MKLLKHFVVLALVAFAALGVTAAATAQSDDDERVVLTVGVTSNSFDTLNPLVGYTVLDYDPWIQQYDTLTRKAAADFETIPGLAESWEKSNGGKTYTYTAPRGSRVVRRRAADGK